MNSVAIVGYSGHSYVVLESLERMGGPAVGYFDLEKKSLNPFELAFLGRDTPENLAQHVDKLALFIAIGDNRIRELAFERGSAILPMATVIDQQALVSARATIRAGAYVARGSFIGPLADIHEGVIVNTCAIIEHECVIGAFSHIAPGTKLAGNVRVGRSSFIGSNAVILNGVRIGDNVTVGAGAVVITDVPDGNTVVGVPAKPVRAKVA